MAGMYLYRGELVCGLLCSRVRAHVDMHSEEEKRYEEYYSIILYGAHHGTRPAGRVWQDDSTDKIKQM